MPKERNVMGQFAPRATEEWSTHPQRSHVRTPWPWWKHYTGEACPHGRHVVLVDGTHVRNKYDSDFCQGGNGFAYPFVPRNEIWLDACMPPAERALVTFHECLEAELMLGGQTYDQSHVEAKRQEDLFRHQQK